MTSSLRGAAGVVALLGATAAVTGCSSSDRGGAEAVTPASAVREYHAEQVHLELAPRWAWPEHVAFATSGPDGAPMLYQRGYGTTQADHYWYCSWESRMVRSDLGASSRARATEQLRAVRSTHLYVEDVIAVDRPYFNRVLDTALAGDLRLMRRDVRLNCPAQPSGGAGRT
ncbi:MAG: hypothetical protein JWO76_225 [Nocardioides sp.]|nr:hypothetical protein [Nocardioides sp.]